MVSESIIPVGLIVCSVSPTGVKAVTTGVVGWNNGRIPDTPAAPIDGAAPTSQEKHA